MATTKIIKNGQLNRFEAHACGKSKREVYGWSDPGPTGDFIHLDKHLLHVDKTYQRDASEPRLQDIARNWSWAACGVILVAQRGDNRYYVYDGQHRVLAARRRDDIQQLPCMVVGFEELSDEARAFVLTNTVRGTVSALSTYNADLVAGDPIAIGIREIVEEYGYRIPRKPGGGRNTVSCVSALKRVYKRGASHFRRVMTAVRALCGEESPRDTLIVGLSKLDMHLKGVGATIERSDIADKLMLIGGDRLVQRARALTELKGGGEKTYAAAFIDEINKGKRTKKIPTLV